MMNLACLTYVNLSRNSANALGLLDLGLFKKLKILVDKYLIHEQMIKETAEGASSSLLTQSRNVISNDLAVETSIVCYVNSIFNRLLNNPDPEVRSIAKELCLIEEGYVVFLNILQRP